MDRSTLTDLFTHAVVTSAFAPVMALLWKLIRRRIVVITLTLAMIANASIQFATESGATWLQQYPTSSAALGNLVWTIAMLWIAIHIRLSSGLFQLIFWSLWLCAAAVLIVESAGFAFSELFSESLQVLFAFVTLYAFERVIKSGCLSAHERTVMIAMGVLVFLDIFELVLAISGYQAAEWIAQGQYLAYSGVGIFLASWAGYLLIRGDRDTHLGLSSSAALHGTSLLSLAAITTAAVFMVNLIGVDNRFSFNAALTVTVVAVIAFVVIASVSNSMQGALRVWISKHFFRHRYDYREQWLRVNHRLSMDETAASPEEKALSVLVTATDSTGGVLWLREDGDYRVVAGKAKAAQSIDNLCPMVSRMRDSGWIYVPSMPKDSEAGQFNADLPQWTGEFWMILPLRVNQELIGFVGLSAANKIPTFDFESLDIARLSSGQVASFLQLHQYERASEQNAQFALYTQMSSFLMHDLNNVLHQQTLLLSNAQQHKTNPDFVNDMIESVDNSVTRLRTLISRLGVGGSQDQKQHALINILNTAVQVYSSPDNPPTLDMRCENAMIDCDADRLAMAIGHIIKNAQDASCGGPVSVNLDTQGRFARIQIQDCGGGMSPEFIRDQLFKPFASTKQSSGMGIGVYLTKTYVEQIGGSIKVESSNDVGTHFSLFLPLA